MDTYDSRPPTKRAVRCLRCTISVSLPALPLIIEKNTSANLARTERHQCPRFSHYRLCLPGCVLRSANQRPYRRHRMLALLCFRVFYPLANLGGSRCRNTDVDDPTLSFIYGCTQIGDDHPRCCSAAGISAGGVTPALFATQVVQRHVGFSNTRT